MTCNRVHLYSTKLGLTIATTTIDDAARIIAAIEPARKLSIEQVTEDLTNGVHFICQDGLEYRPACV